MDLRITRSPDLIAAETGDQMVGLHIQNGTCYCFNETAYRVWQLCAEPTTLSALCAAMREEYDVDPETCETGLRLVIENLAGDGLVALETL